MGERRSSLSPAALAAAERARRRSCEGQRAQEYARCDDAWRTRQTAELGQASTGSSRARPDSPASVAPAEIDVSLAQHGP
jgi:hypothetical protein